jgi:hypothetical protein
MTSGVLRGGARLVLDPEAGKPLRRKVNTGNGNAECTSVVLAIIPYIIDYKDGERGRNRTYNLLIKSPNAPSQDQSDSASTSENSGKVLQNPQPPRNKRGHQ